MANCGCKPCKVDIPKKTKTCKPFNACVGNYVLVWDGSCLSKVERTYQIPDGTYTSITYADGCVVGVGQAPIPEYTPQACCEGTVEQGGGSSQSLTRAPTANNLVTISNNQISVEPNWDTSGNIRVSGSGTAARPWKPSVRVSSAAGNTLAEVADGLYASVAFSTSDTVTVTGSGTATSPYKFNVKQAEFSLPEINSSEVDSNGVTIQKNGLVKADEGTVVTTNLRFDSSAFTVTNTGSATVVAVDERALRGEAQTIYASAGITGYGTQEAPLSLDLTTDVVNAMLDIIQTSPTLTQKLQNILGVKSTSDILAEIQLNSDLTERLKTTLGIKDSTDEPVVS